MITLYAIIYIVGSVLGYLFVKKVVLSYGDGWTVIDRAFAIFWSIFSWLTFLAALIVYIILNTDSDKPARW